MTESERPSDVKPPSPARWLRPGRFLRDLNIVALLALIAVAAGLFMSPRSDDVLLGLPDLEVGDRSPRTIRSPRALTISDPENTEDLRDEAARKVSPVFDQEIWLVEQAKQRVSRAFDILAGVEPDADTTEKARQEAFSEALGVVLKPRILGALLGGRPDELRDAVLSILSTVGERPIVPRSRDLPVGVDQITVRHVAQDERPVRELEIGDLDTLLTLDQARAMVDALAADRLAHLEVLQRRGVAMLAKALIEDNLVRNAAETRRRRQLARDSVKAVVIAIAPGEVVVKNGAPVDEQKLRILRGMAADLRATSQVQVTAGSVLLMMLLVAFAYPIGARSCRPGPPEARDLAFWATAMLLMLLMLWAGYHGVAFVIDTVPSWTATTLRMGLPVAFGVLLVRLVSGSEAAAIFIVIVSVAAGWTMDASFPFAVYTAAGGLAAASIPDGPRLSRSLFNAATRIIFAQLVAAMAFDLLDSSLELSIAGEHLAAATVSGVTSALVTAVALAAVEAVFGYATSLRLGQLSNLNHPLLKQMLVEAPGTYHHSILVGTLAEAAAERIGANPMLARVGGYYHDIGKLKNPRAFDENEVREVGPALSAAEADELKAHVADGVEFALQHRLGASVIDVVRQHHGTQRVGRRSFPATQGPITGEVLTYAGPRPMARETALVMLADTVEASTRHLEHELVLERPRIEQAVQRAVQDVLQDGQLDDSALTVRDLESTRQAFVEVLEARFSRRGRPLNTLPAVTGAPLVRAPGGEPS